MSGGSFVQIHCRSIHITDLYCNTGEKIRYHHAEISLNHIEIYAKQTVPVPCEDPVTVFSVLSIQIMKIYKTSLMDIFKFPDCDLRLVRFGDKSVHLLVHDMTECGIYKSVITVEFQSLSITDHAYFNLTA